MKRPGWIRSGSKTQSIKVQRLGLKGVERSCNGEDSGRGHGEESLGCFYIHVHNRSHVNLELLVSRWSTETHTLVTSWGEFTPTLENVSVMFPLSMFADEGTTSLVLSTKEEKKVQLLSFALRISNKSTYASWIRYFWGR